MKLLKENYKFKQKNYEFWVERLKSNSPDQVCTNDIGLNVLETDAILSRLSDGKAVLEIGCGNGILYKDLRQAFDLAMYVGTDFVRELIVECEKNRTDDRDSFHQLDMTLVNSNSFNTKFDFIISKRAIQNVLDHRLQLEAIDEFGSFLADDGLMVLVESSGNALQRINSSRVKYGLPKITAPFHNLFFNDQLIRKYNFKNVNLLKIEPFSSDFYFVTRIIYARYAQEYLKEEPTYDHPLQKIALSLSKNQSTKDFSQVQCYLLTKKK